MRLRSLLTPLLTVGLCTMLSVQAYAASRVFWDARAVSAVPAQHEACPKLVDDAVLTEIGGYVDAKLKASMLPFDLVVKDDLQNANLTEKINDEIKYALIPLVLDDSSTVEFFTAGGVDYYKTIVRTNISLMLCAYGGALQNRVSFLYNIPMNGYGVLRTNVPVTKEQLRIQFLSNAQQLINRRLKIPANIENFMNPEYGKTITYRVEEVSISPTARGLEVFEPGYLEKEVLPTVASAYTTGYAQAHPEYVVLPENCAGDVWKRAIINHIDSNLTQGLVEEESSDVHAIKLAINYYKKDKDEASTKTSLLMKWYVIVGLEDITDPKNIKQVMNTRTYEIPVNIDSITQINIPGAFGSAARKLASQ